MDSSSFYMVLPSNSSFSYFPRNKAHRYRTKLAHTLYLEGQWEVALITIQYPHTWFNIGSVNNAVKYAGINGENTINIPPGHYDNVNSLVETLNKSLALSSIVFRYNEIYQRVNVDIQRGFSVILDEHIAQMLGFSTNVVFHGNTVAKYPPNLQLGMYSLFVYSDIVQPFMVGESKSNLLGIAEVQGEDGQVVTKTFERPMYVPLCKQQMDTVEIDISRDTGEEVQFMQGKVTCTLHFRRRHFL